MAKSVRIFLLGILLVLAGALLHSHAEDWSLHIVQTAMSSSGSMEVVNYPVKYAYQDLGIAMMGLGAISFTLGLIAWLYPPRES